MITSQVESFIGILSELQKIFPEHYEALSLHWERGIPLQPRYAAYQAYEHRGELSTVTLRENGALIGYWTSIVAPGLHYETCLTATMDMFYICREARRRYPAIYRRLLRATERELRRRGVRVWFAGHKLRQMKVGRMFAANGFEPVETYYCKWLR